MRKSPTRDRVLSVTLDLLNRDGVDRVTTRRIAEAAGINEGNLYYHFKTREALFTAVFEQFEAAALLAMAPVAPVDLAGEAAASMAAYTAVLDRWFRLTWSYRFLFRDALALQAAAPGLRRALSRLSLRLMAELGEVLDAMQRAGLLLVPEAIRGRLLTNVAIVSSYWVSFLAMQRGAMQRGATQRSPARLTRAHLRWGHDQVRAVYWPYLSPAAQEAALRAAAMGDEV